MFTCFFLALAMEMEPDDTLFDTLIDLPMNIWHEINPCDKLQQFPLAEETMTGYRWSPEQIRAYQTLAGVHELDEFAIRLYGLYSSTAPLQVFSQTELRSYGWSVPHIQAYLACLGIEFKPEAQEQQQQRKKPTKTKERGHWKTIPTREEMDMTLRPLHQYRVDSFDDSLRKTKTEVEAVWMTTQANEVTNGICKTHLSFPYEMDRRLLSAAGMSFQLDLLEEAFREHKTVLETQGSIFEQETFFWTSFREPSILWRSLLACSWETEQITRNSLYFSPMFKGVLRVPLRWSGVTSGVFLKQRYKIDLYPLFGDVRWEAESNRQTYYPPTNDFLLPAIISDHLLYNNSNNNSRKRGSMAVWKQKNPATSTKIRRNASYLLWGHLEEDIRWLEEVLQFLEGYESLWLTRKTGLFDIRHISANLAVCMEAALRVIGARMEQLWCQYRALVALYTSFQIECESCQPFSQILGMLWRNWRSRIDEQQAFVPIPVEFQVLYDCMQREIHRVLVPMYRQIHSNDRPQKYINNKEYGRQNAALTATDVIVWSEKKPRIRQKKQRAEAMLRRLRNNPIL